MADLFKVGDTGLTKDGKDTYRVIATNGVFRPVGTTEMPICVLRHPINDPYESYGAYSKDGWSTSHAMAGNITGGANTDYDLVPPVRQANISDNQVR